MSSLSLGTSDLWAMIAASLMLVLLAPTAIFVILVVANRADPDPTRRRPVVAYLLAISFVMLWTAFGGALAVAFSLVNLIGSHIRGGAGGSIHPVGDATARGVVLGGLILVVSLIARGTHLRRARSLLDRVHEVAGPSERVFQSYVSIVSFIAVLIVVVSWIVAFYSVAQLIAPGVFLASGTRTATVRVLIDSVFAAMVAWRILGRHRHLNRPADLAEAGEPA